MSSSICIYISKSNGSNQRPIKPEMEKRELDKVWDLSVDHKGRPPVRASTGAWKAALFIISIEFSERLSYFGISTSLIIYLTKFIHEDVKMAAKNVNYWLGVTTLMPLLGAFLADSYLGRYTTVICSSIIYLLGMLLLTMAWFVPSLKPCATSQCQEPRKVHEVIFFIALYLISVGTGGHKPSLESFGADQFDENDSEERRKKMSFFNWWNSGLCAGLLFGVTFIVYVQEHVNWGISYIILTIVMAVALLIFLIGTPFYRYRVPNGSPLTPLLQVLVAAFVKRRVPYPSDPSLLHEALESNFKGRRLCHTKTLKFLDKAAVVEEGDKSSREQSPWRLATVTQVEELKLVVNMIPIWITTVPFGICVAQTSTFFVKQSTLMDRKIGHHFLIPPASLYGLGAVGMIISVSIYDRLLIPFFRRANGSERGISILQRIGVGLVFSTAGMIVAGIVERRRLGVAGESGSEGISVFWLAPQYLIIGLGDGFTLVGLQEFFYDQVPDTMRSLGIAFYLSVSGAANFVSGFLITVVDRATEKRGRSWFGNDLNTSRIDKFYFLLAGLTAASLCVYVVVAMRYRYKSVAAVTGTGGDSEARGGGHSVT